MSNLVGKVRNLKNEGQKFEKWNELSTELKLECMKSLDFGTRWNLRSTSKTSKFLVDSQKIKIDRVSIDSDKQIIEITQNGVIFKKKYVVNNEFIAFYEYIARHGIMEILIIDGSDYKKFPNLQYALSVKNLEFNKVSTLETSFWLYQMNYKLLKSVEFGEATESEEFFRIPQKEFIPSFRINGSKLNEDDVGQVAQIWINLDAEIGKKFQVVSAVNGSFEKFSERFWERIVSKSKNSVRITTNNPERHILLEANFKKRNLQMTVIPKPEDLFIAPYQFEKWNELPKEVKMECIKWVDIWTRMNLRETSKTERALVDSKKFNIDYAAIQLDHNAARLDKNFVKIFLDGEFYHREFSTKKRQVKFCKHLLEHAIFEHLQIFFNDHEPVADLLHETKRPYSVKNVEFCLMTPQYQENMAFWLGRMGDKLKSLEIDLSGFRQFQIENILVHPNVTNIPLIKICQIENIDTTDKLARVWIDNDAKMGNKYQARVLNFGPFERFSSAFKDRLVFESANIMCIKTDNPSKNILLQAGHPRYGWNGITRYFQMTVIPADLKKYDDSEEWIRNWEKKSEMQQRAHDVWIRQEEALNH